MTKTVKTKGARFDDLTAAIQDIHPYDVPEVIALPITMGAQNYLAWLDAVVDG